LDALTNGAVTSETTQVQFGVLVTNDSSNAYNLITVMPSSISVTNFPANALTDSATATFANNGWSTVPAFSSHLYYLLNPPSVLTFKHVSNKYAIKATVVLTTKLYTNISSTPTTTYNNMVVEDIIYTPSNNDLIPTILNTLNNISTTIQGFWSQLTSLQNGENYIVNQEVQLQSGENYIVNQEKQTQSGENYIVNQESQLQSDENYIVNQESQIESGENYIVNQEKQTQTGENYIVNQDTQIEAGESEILNKIK
jgi:hypothetical protein